MWQNALVLTAENSSQRESFTIASFTQLHADIYIPATPALIWQTFRQVETWQRWYPDVISAAWQRGDPWVAQSEISIQVKNSLGQIMSSIATVKPSPPDQLVWENRGAGLVTRCTAQVDERAGRALFSMHKSYSGPTAVLMILLKARQKAMLQAGLENLKTLVLS